MSTRSRSRALLVAALLLVVLAAPAAASAGRQVRILGGTTAAPGQFPWMTALVDAGARSAIDGIFCGGTLIAPRVVLTAGHCVEGSKAGDFVAVVGRTRLSRSSDGQRLGVTRIVRHPAYDRQTTVNDLALLQLAAPATATPLVLAGAADGALQAAGSPVTVSGFGVTSEGGSVSDQLRSVNLLVRSTATCRRVYGDISAATQVCAGSSRPGEDSCQGDSGGPLFAGEGAAARLVGIVSFGDGCGKAGVPAVYTRVSGFTDWIAQQTALLNGDTPSPPPVSRPPTVRIGRIGCGISTCTVSLKVTGRAPAGGIVLNVVRHRSAHRKAVDRFVFARRSSSGTWKVRTDLPFGKLTLYAIPLTAAQDDLDGNGDVLRVEIVPA